MSVAEPKSVNMLDKNKLIQSACEMTQLAIPQLTGWLQKQ